MLHVRIEGERRCLVTSDFVQIAPFFSLFSLSRMNGRKENTAQLVHTDSQQMDSISNGNTSIIVTIQRDKVSEMEEAQRPFLCI